MCNCRYLVRSIGVSERPGGRESPQRQGCEISKSENMGAASCHTKVLCLVFTTFGSAKSTSCSTTRCSRCTTGSSQQRPLAALDALAMALGAACRTPHYFRLPRLGKPPETLVALLVSVTWRAPPPKAIAWRALVLLRAPWNVFLLARALDPKTCLQ